VTLKELLAADIERLQVLRGEAPRTLGRVASIRAIFSPRLMPVFLCRLAHAAHSRGQGRLARLFSLVNFLLFGLEVSPQIVIGPGLFFPHTYGTVVGARSIGANATIFHQVTIGASELDMGFNPDRRPVLGDDVTLGAGAKVLGSIVIGDRVTVGANSVVVRDVPSDVVCAGVPAAVVREKCK
jgi:serine O-acetyltransferase